MAFLTLSDYENEIDVTIFPNIYASYFDLLAVNKMIGVIGQYQIREDKAQILANVILNLEDQL
jgi:DNA polymerase III alpha subunit